MAQKFLGSGQTQLDRRQTGFENSHEGVDPVDYALEILSQVEEIEEVTGEILSAGDLGRLKRTYASVIMGQPDAGREVVKVSQWIDATRNPVTSYVIKLVSGETLVINMEEGAIPGDYVTMREGAIPLIIFSRAENYAGETLLNQLKMDEESYKRISKLGMTLHNVVKATNPDYAREYGDNSAIFAKTYASVAESIDYVSYDLYRIAWALDWTWRAVSEAYHAKRYPLNRDLRYYFRKGVAFINRTAAKAAPTISRDSGPLARR